MCSICARGERRRQWRHTWGWYWWCGQWGFGKRGNIIFIQVLRARCHRNCIIFGSVIASGVFSFADILLANFFCWHIQSFGTFRISLNCFVWIIHFFFALLCRRFIFIFSIHFRYFFVHWFMFGLLASLLQQPLIQRRLITAWNRDRVFSKKSADKRRQVSPRRWKRARAWQFVIVVKWRCWRSWRSIVTWK